MSTYVLAQQLTDQPNAHSWNRRIWIERPKVELREPNRGIQSLWYGLHVRQRPRITGLLQCQLRPLLSDHALRIRHIRANDRQHEVVPIRIIAGVLEYQLASA